MGLRNYLFLHNRLNITRKDIVMEVGAGGDPFLRSDFYIEKYLEDDTERYTKLVLDRPTIAADGSLLPFPDKSIDFIYCSQVLEHIPNPQKFLDELSRVGRRGLLITPHADYEKLHPKGGHLWYIWVENEVLNLKQKYSWDEYPDFSNYYRKIVRLPKYWKFYNRNYDFFNVIYLWKDRIKYSIQREGQFDFSKFSKSNQLTDKEVIKKNLTLKLKMKIITKKILHRLLSSNNKLDIITLLCCPFCKGNLSNELDKEPFLICYKCDKKFLVKNSIPYFF